MRRVLRCRRSPTPGWGEGEANNHPREAEVTHNPIGWVAVWMMPSGRYSGAARCSSRVRWWHYALWLEQ